MSPTVRDRADAVHGTSMGWLAHRKRGEEPCFLCSEAHRNDNDLRNKQRKARIRWPR